jgi:hypothetical protein
MQMVSHNCWLQRHGLVTARLASERPGSVLLSIAAVSRLCVIHGSLVFHDLDAFTPPRERRLQLLHNRCCDVQYCCAHVSLSTIHVHSVTQVRQQCVLFCIVVLCSVDLHVFLSQYETHLDLNVKCPIVSSTFNEIWIFFTGFHKSLQNQISRKSVLWIPSWYIWTDGQTGMLTF